MAFKILFMGTPDFAVPSLKSIYQAGHKILEVYTQPPKRKNRGQKIQNSPIHEEAKKLNLKIRHPISLKEEKEIEHFVNLRPDIVVVVAYGKILPENLLNLGKVPFINIHASLLPKWRGAAPIQRSIMNMDEETGISIMKIISKLDAGPVLTQSRIKMKREFTYEKVSKKLSELGAKLIIDTLKLIENNNFKLIEQNETEATYAKKIEKSEARINWNNNANKIIAKINALHPNPGSWFEYLGNRIKIIKAKEINKSGKPGLIIDDKFTIACSKNAIQILELKKEGKQKMSTSDFLRGNDIKIGHKIN